MYNKENRRSAAADSPAEGGAIPMYEAIVLDLGGVVVDFDPRSFLMERLCN